LDEHKLGEMFGIVENQDGQVGLDGLGNRDDLTMCCLSVLSTGWY